MIWFIFEKTPLFQDFCLLMHRLQRAGYEKQKNFFEKKNIKKKNYKKKKIYEKKKKNYEKQK